MIVKALRDVSRSSWLSAETGTPVDFAREICCSLSQASEREWLVTNGIGGFASGTIAGVLTRRYHGLLIAALKPPLGRTLLVTKLEETARYDGEDYPLSTDRWADGTLSPEGYRHIERLIAGYPWFGDWGRDTMIALPGLTIATGRTEVARSVLQTFARFVDRGMLPNVFPDIGETPEYNTVDATLWYFEAIRQYFSATRDEQFLVSIFPTLAEIIDCHSRGTRYNIQVDSADGL